MNDHPDPHYDAPHDVANRYLQWRLHQEKLDPHWDVSMLPTCLHCCGDDPCTEEVCKNDIRPDSKTLH